MSKKGSSSGLDLSKKDLEVVDKALAILLKNDPGADNAKKSKDYLKKATGSLGGYFGTSTEAQLALLELSLTQNQSISAELTEKKKCTGGCRGACKISCVTSCKGTCKGGCKTGVTWF